ncbi:MAG: ABC transporter permease [Anaerolineae bacterium]|nr:ABC transporter permease [Gemmatimonadaceae bacterium]
MRTILFLMRKEYLQIFRDRTTLFQIFFIPIVQLLILSNAATFEVTNARMHIVDFDRTTTSQRLVQHLTASGSFTVAATSLSLDRANDDMLSRKVSVVLNVPRDFERELVRNGNAPVQLLINAEEGAAAGIIASSATRIMAGYSRELSAELRPRFVAVRAGSARSASAAMPTIDVRTRGWYNSSLNYKHYMVPGILVSLTTIIGMLLTAQNIAREKEVGTLEQLNVTPITRGQFIAGKLLPFWIIALVTFTIGLTIAKLVFGVPMRGSLLLVYLAAALYLVVALGIGLWISTITRTQQQTMFVSFFVMMIFLLMSGLFTPLDSMPMWAQWLAELNPVKHFVLIMRGVLVRGAGFAAIATPLGILAVYGIVVLSASVRQYKKTTA